MSRRRQRRKPDLKLPQPLYVPQADTNCDYTYWDFAEVIDKYDAYHVTRGGRGEVGQLIAKDKRRNKR